MITLQMKKERKNKTYINYPEKKTVLPVFPVKKIKTYCENKMFYPFSLIKRLDPEK